MRLKLSGKIKITENDVKRQIKDYLSIKGYFHFHIFQGLGSYKGIVDRIAVKNGRVLFIEVKKPGGTLSDEQKEFRTNMKKAGGEYHVVRSLEEIIKILEV